VDSVSPQPQEEKLGHHIEIIRNNINLILLCCGGGGGGSSSSSSSSSNNNL
jgi:hypothetical protein